MKSLQIFTMYAVFDLKLRFDLQVSNQDST
jgi:hypothetical protein